eukprot:RCo044170
MAGEEYLVKGVTSGDTLLLLVPNKLPPVERTVTLAGVEVPKVARKTPVPTQDEPYGWEAREFVRKKLIGKPVTYHHEYTVDKVERNFGQITYGPQKENLAVALVAEGLAEPR